MNIINTIMDDFFNCCNLPILALDINFNKLDAIGHDALCKNIINSINFCDDINLDEESYIHLKYDGDTNFIVTNISRFNKFRGYFVIGPFNTEERGYLPFKTKSCIVYIPGIVSSISDSVFSKGLSNTSYSTYTRKAIYYVHNNYITTINIDDLCRDLNINKSYFCKLFKKETGFTFSSFINNYRIEKSKELLINTNHSLLHIAVSVGFNNQNYYSSVFKKLANISPLEFRNNFSH